MVKFWGQGCDQRRQSPIHQELVGTSNDVQVAINNIECKALLDTGATVSSISKTFYDYYLAHITKLFLMGEHLYIECADGQTLLYLGYVSVNLTLVVYLPLIFRKIASLIVPDSDYNT